MTVEERLLEKWRMLPPDKQQEVFDFVEFLQARSPVSNEATQPVQRTELSQKLQQLREAIVTSGVPLLTDEEIDREVAERRGGYQEPE